MTSRAWMVVLLLAGCSPAMQTPPPSSDGGTIPWPSGDDASQPPGEVASDAGQPPPVTDGDVEVTPGDLLPPSPVTTQPAPLLPGTGLYPRLVQLKLGANAGAILASVVAPQASGRMGGTVLISRDEGVSFTVQGHIDDPITSTGLCCATLFELPRAVGALAAGTLLWSASVGGDAPAQPMSIVVWSSTDSGKTWTRLSTIVTGAVPRSKGGLWEPEFVLLADGTLVVHFSDETDAAHSQKLVEARSSDGVTWGSFTDTIALADFGARPGMANVRRLPSGSYLMSYEVCGVAPNCSVHLRTSADGWQWGDAHDAGWTPTTVDGRFFAHAPTLVWTDRPGANGRLYLVGQMLYESGGQVSSGNGSVVFGNTESGGRSWFEVPAPVPVKDPYDNYCPNYSSALLPLDDGAIGLEVASAWDGTVCRASFARGRLDGGTTGPASGSRNRLVNVMSGLCLDVSEGSTAAGARIQQWTCNGLDPQRWTVTTAADGSFSLKAVNSGLCLAVAGGAATAGAALEQRACDGSALEAWVTRPVGLGYLGLQLRGTAFCLDDAGGSTTAGTGMQLWSCNDLSPQIWHLEPQ